MRPFGKHTLHALIGTMLLLGGSFTSCERQDDVPAPAANRNTLLMYVVGDNNISDYMQRSVNSVISGMDPGYLLDNTVLIYVDANSYSGRTNAPQLLELIPGSDGLTTTRLVAEYPEQNSANIAVLDEMIAIMRSDYPATGSYGLMISSHATGWLPSNFTELLRSRAIGNDGNNWIEIDQLADAIPDGLFDYILFDACYMGSVEVAYAMRDKADFIIASPTELWAEGMPYQSLGPCFFGLRPDPRAFCDALFDKYDTPQRGSTVSLIETARLDELGALLREVFYGRQDQIRALDISRMQTYGSRTYAPLFIDLADLVKSLAAGAQFEQFNELLEQIVPYHLYSNTLTFPDGSRAWTIDHSNGLSSYVPQARYPLLDAVYYQTEWAKNLFGN